MSGPEITTDTFKSHIISLLSFYELGPHHGVTALKYEGPPDTQIDTILRSLDVIVKRMWAAEATLNIPRSPLDDTKVAELGYQVVHHADASPSTESTEDICDPGDARNDYEATTYNQCPTCGNALKPAVVQSIAEDYANSSVLILPSSILVVPGGTEDHEISSTEELRILKSHLSDVARVCAAVSRGDLSQKITTPVYGPAMIQLKDVVNNMTDNLAQIANEVIRSSREMGTDGILGVQILLPDVGSQLGDMITNFNTMASNITSQVRSISVVSKAVCLGDLSKQIEVESKGEILTLKNTVNNIVLRQRFFFREVNQVILDIGSMGKLGGRAEVPDAEGVWLELVKNVNGLSSNITSQVRCMYQVLTAVARGDLEQSVQVHAEGEMSALKATINGVVTYLNALVGDITSVCCEIGIQGSFGGAVEIEGMQGSWANLMRNINNVAYSMTTQVRAIAEVTKAIALGDLSKRLTIDVQGEMLDLKEMINLMADQLDEMVKEIIRLNLEAGTEGVLGGQALIRNPQGSWKALVDGVNTVVMTLTNSVRSTSEMTKAIACGDLSIRMELDARGEILDLKDTMNGTAEFLKGLTDEVTRVTRAVGTEGRLGFQAVVPHVGGTWKELVDSVNVLTANLTLQVRTAAVVLVAVARGDLSQKFQDVTLPGEMAGLVNLIEDMIDVLTEFADKSQKIARQGDSEDFRGQLRTRSVIGIWNEILIVLADEFDKNTQHRVGDKQEVYY